MKKKRINGDGTVPLLTKLLQIMKVSLFLIFILAQVSASTYSQTAKLTLSLEKVTLSEFFNKIEENSEFKFFYDNQEIDPLAKISVNADKSTIENILVDIFSDTDVSYEIFDRYIILKKKPQSGIAKKSLTKLQEITVKGIVTDASGIPLPGVNVVEKGTTNGAITNIEGEYTISINSLDAILIFSFVGYLTENIEVAGQNSINITMIEDIQSLDEVVVIGYGTVKKRDLTGAVSSVKSEDLIVPTQTSVAQMLSGKVSGLQSQIGTAQPGGDVSFQIRGASSVNASNSPLIIIDGFPVTEFSSMGESGNRYDGGSVSALNSLNPSDIASVEVLKDASSTAIYGARAANGVIIITTKSGQSGSVKVNYEGSYSIQKQSSVYDMLSGPELMTEVNRHLYEVWLYDNEIGVYGGKTEADAASPFTPRFSSTDIANAPNTKWMDQILRTGAVQQHNLSLNGGSENTKYYFSGGYYDNKGLIKNSALNRYTFRLNLDQKLGKHLKAGIKTTGSRILQDNSQLGTGKWENGGIIQAALTFPSFLPVRDDEGEFTISDMTPWNPNPVSMLDITDESNFNRLLAGAYIEYNPIPELIVRMNAGADLNRVKRSTYLPKTTLYGQVENGLATISQEERYDSNFDLTVNYSKDFGDIHSIQALGGYSYQKFTHSGFLGSQKDFITDAFLYNNLGAGDYAIPTIGSSGGKDEIASYFVRFNYSLKDRYLLTSTMRADGASNFAKNKKWGYFPSVALAWRISDEAFMSSITSVVSNLKLRVSAGQTGNSSIGYAAFSTYEVGPYTAIGNQTTKGISLSQLENPDLTWETSTEKNIGLDFGLFGEKISGSFEVYNRVTSDLLAEKSLMSYQEVNTIAANIGKTQSKGFEITIVTRNISRPDFSWKTDLTFSGYKDTWLERDPDWSPAIYESENDPIRAIYKYRADGLVQPSDIGNIAQNNPIPGQVKIKDVNGYKRDADGNPVVDDNGHFVYLGEPDGKIDQADVELIGSEDPGYNFGINNTIKYKNFDLNVYFYGWLDKISENSMYAQFALSAEEFARNSNQLSVVRTRWTNDNQSSLFPSSLQSYSSYSYGDFLMEPGWFLRCKNITLGYTFPTTIINKFSTRMYVDVQNLFVITDKDFNDLDPESGLQRSSYPTSRSFTLGINLTF